MKNQYLLILVLLLSTLSIKSIAQTEGTLTGSVVDEENQAIGFVNVAVLDAATTAVITGSIADMNGNFRIKAPAKGTYLLKLSGLGYVTTQTEPFVVTGEGFSKDFGKLQLKQDVKTLGEVTVQAMRPTIITEADKMVVSVENTALASGSTAYEVLEKSPGVWIDQDGNIKLNGKAGVQIMLNGRQSFLTGKDLQNLLQSMSAENIKDLEIITNPSAKYDAEGTSGIININLKKNVLFGMNGSVHAGYQYNRLHTYTSGGDISYKKGKWNTSINFDLARRMRYRDFEMERVFNNEGNKSTYDQVAYEEGERLTPSLRFNTDYDLNDRHSIGAMANLSYTNVDNLFASDSYLRDGNVENDQFISATNLIDGSVKNGTFNLHYVGKLDSAGTTLSADLDYVKIINRDEFKFRNLYDSLSINEPVRIDLLSSTNPTNYDIYSAKVDFVKPLSKGNKLELGAKTSYVVSDNELRFYEIIDNKSILDPKRTSHFIYKENIYAAYATFSAKLGTKWNLKAGLRAEQTVSEGNSITTAELTERNYLDLFPSVFLQQRVSENYQISYKYSRRINRPYYGNLNPFIFYLDPYTWSQGNPYLKPQYTNSFEVTQTLKSAYNLVLGYSVTKDFIAEVPLFNAEDNTTVFKQQNVDDFINANATLVAPVRISNKWEMSNNASLIFQKFTSLLPNGSSILNEQFTFVAQSNQNIQLPQGVRLEMNAGYQGPGVFGLYEFKGMWWLDAGLKRSFLNDKLDLTLNVTDIFKSRQLIINIPLDGNSNYMKQYQGAQSVRVGLRYRFNKGREFEAKKRNINLDELNRTGN